MDGAAGRHSATIIAAEDKGKLLVTRNELRRVLLSDTHQFHREVRVPDGDLLIHAGDFTVFSKSRSAILDFSKWLGELRHHHKIIIPGNHAFFLEANPFERSVFTNAVVLINEGIEIESLQLLGVSSDPSLRRCLWAE